MLKAVLCLCLALLGPSLWARPWRIGYVEGKPFENYASTLAALASGLKEMGWIASVEGLPYTPGQTGTRAMWTWLSEHGGGSRLTFAADGYYSFPGLDGPAITRAAEPLVQRLRDAGDLDLVIAMGTDAGRVLATDAHRVPVMVFSTSNAVAAGIIKSPQDSGRDHVWAHVDPDRYRRQIEVFHDIFRFKRLGIAYEDSPSGRTYAAVADIEAVARQRGFQVVRELVKQPEPGRLEAFYRNLRAAHQRLAAQVDAAYFGLFVGIQPERLPELFAPFTERRIPVFAQQAPDDVRCGALMSVARADFKGVGRFGAGAIVRVLNGTPPRQVSQIYANSPYIILNLKVARAIGYRPSFDILLVADEIFPETAGAP
jgi:ABC-type uncharacterized transport system substrate-binding protein